MSQRVICFFEVPRPLDPIRVHSDQRHNGDHSKTGSERFDLHNFVKTSVFPQGITTRFLGEDTLENELQMPHSIVVIAGPLRQEHADSLGAIVIGPGLRFAAEGKLTDQNHGVAAYLSFRVAGTFGSSKPIHSGSRKNESCG